MIKKIIFKPSSQYAKDLVLSPKPSKKYIPQWYKDFPKSHILNGIEVQSASACVPFLDPFLIGYTYELPCDLVIKYNGVRDDTNEDQISYSWYGMIKPVSTREEIFGTPNVFPRFDGYYHTELHWDSFWEPKTPKGYSTVYHHPHNRFDLPFHTMTGVIDTDVWSIGGPVPFLIKKGFEGIIPAGTPIIQTTFIKRDKWVSSEADFDEKEYNQKRQSVKKFLRGGYKKHYWQKKEFN